MQFSDIIEQSPRNWERTMRQNVVLQSWGEGHEVEKNCGRNLSHCFPFFLNLFPRIREPQNIIEWFLKFSTHDDIYFVCGKLSELHFDTKLSSNRGETVT